MAGRYATALFELARDAKSLDAVKADLDRFAALIAGSPDLARLVKSPVFTADEQVKAVSGLLDKAGIGGLAANVIKVIASNRRLFAVGQVIEGYKRMVAAYKGETTAQVTVAAPLSAQHLTALKDALKAVTKKDVQVDLKVDPSIIGGIVVKLGSRMIDSSLKTKLNSIKTAMKEVG
jgi:F-type H+-transporting ATPase subunit delta